MPASTRRVGLIAAAALLGIVLLRTGVEPSTPGALETGTSEARDPEPANGSRLIADPAVSAAPGRTLASDAAEAPWRPGLDPVAPSLADTDLDGAIRFDANGDLIIELDLRRLFDQFLTTLGEQDLRAIRARMATLARSAGNAAQAQAVLDTFERYLTYLRATESVTARDPAERLAALTELRREWLGESMAEAFFGEEERYAAATLERRRVLDDSSLLPEERARALADIDAGLDPRIVATREAAMAHLDVIAETEVFAGEGLSAEERFAARADQYGEAAATRLGELDTARSRWQARVDRYFEALDALAADTSLSETERRQERTRLLSTFEGPEQRRLEALERVRARASGG